MPSITNTNPSPSKVDTELSNRIGSFVGDLNKALEATNFKDNNSKRAFVIGVAEALDDFMLDLTLLEGKYISKETSDPLYYSDNQLYICLARGAIDEVIFGKKGENFYRNVIEDFKSRTSPNEESIENLMTHQKKPEAAGIINSFASKVTDKSLQTNLESWGRDYLKEQCNKKSDIINYTATPPIEPHSPTGHSR